MVSPRRFGALLVASVVAVALIPLQAMPVSAAAATPKPTTADKLAPLPTEEAPKPKLETPTGDFSDPPPAHVDQAPAPQRGKQSFDAVNSKLIEQNATTDTFQNPDGTRTAKIHQDEVNAKDDNGNWKKIDNNLSKKNDGRIHNNFGKFDASFADSADADDLGTLKSGDSTLTFSLDNTKKGRKSRNDGNKVTYDGVFDNTDLSYQVGTSLVSEYLVLNTKPATAPTYRFKVGGKGLTPSVDENGNINYADKSGNIVFHVPQGVAWDSNTTGDYQLKGRVTIALSADKKSLEVTPDWNWLNDPARQYPVTIDPDFGLGADDPNTAHDAWTASDNPNTNFNGNAQKDPLYGNKFENLFGHNSTGTDYTSELFINTDAVKSTYVNSAYLNIYSWEVGSQPACIYPNTQNWDASTVTFNTRPNHSGNCNVGSDPNKVRVSLTNNAYTNIDVTSWVKNWAETTTPNYGFTMDTGGATAIHRTGATEQRANGGQAP